MPDLNTATSGHGSKNISDGIELCTLSILTEFAKGKIQLSWSPQVDKLRWHPQQLLGATFRFRSGMSRKKDKLPVVLPGADIHSWQRTLKPSATDPLS